MSVTDQVAPLPLRKPGSRQILWRCFGYLRRYWRITVGAYAAMLLIDALALVIPQFIRWIVDGGIRGGNARLLGMAVLALLGLTLVKGGLIFLRGRWTEIASQGVAYDLRNAIHSRLAALSFSYHDRAETGQLLSRAVQDVERIRFLTGRAVLSLV
ncbi:MAG: ABC transporter ATP-binding protein, partial [Anaerolineae bacterium]|nr:ABC transporter ATP-binding protein [Anaerolineae bacterium]